MVCFDTETTGTDVETDRIVTAAVVRIDDWTVDGGPLVDTFSIVIDPGIPIPDEAAAIHGWTTERVRKHGVSPDIGLAALTSNLISVLSQGGPKVLVIMNAPFDLTLLDRDQRRHGIPHPIGDLSYGLNDPIPVLDPMVIDRQIDRYRPGTRTLADLCTVYGVTLDTVHDAAADATAAGRIMWRIGQMAGVWTRDAKLAHYRGAGRHRPAANVEILSMLAAMTPAELHEAQRAWRAAQVENFGAYLCRERDGLIEVGKDPFASAQEEIDNAGSVATLTEKINGLRGDWPIIPYRLPEVTS